MYIARTEIITEIKTFSQGEEIPEKCVTTRMKELGMVEVVHRIIKKKETPKQKKAREKRELKAKKKEELKSTELLTDQSSNVSVVTKEESDNQEAIQENETKEAEKVNSELGDGEIEDSSPGVDTEEK